MIEHTFAPTESFRDPVHGFIRVSKRERTIINRPEMQRLRRIHQLGPGCLIYHGAEHSRFGHALGVMEVASRLFDAIELKRPEALGADQTARKRTRQLLRLAALLHDVGHAPFSHSTEEIMPVGPDNRPYEHVDYTCAIIESEGMAQAIQIGFGEMGISAQMVSRLIEGSAALGDEGVLLHQLIAGELDADRMDYLARDSMYCGVIYGSYDVHRLLDTVTVAKWGKSRWLLAVESGGKYALEAFLLARYYMFLQVYLHDVRRFYDIALARFLASLLPGGRYPPPTQVEQYLGYDDLAIWQLARGRAAEGDAWGNVLWNRAHWRTIAETEPHPPPELVLKWRDARESIERQFNEAVIFDDAVSAAYRARQYGPYDTESAEEEGKYPILVAEEGKPDGLPIERISRIVQNLNAHIILLRLYAHPDRESDVKAAWNAAYGAGGAR
jgi:HD superfamily phosphohydrolase